MPTYDYRCTACEHEFELFQSMSEGAKKKCPACGRMALERLIGTGAAVLFKGSGFYETDYRSESYKKAEKAEKDTPKGESKAESTPDKGAKKAESKPDTPKKPASKKD
ncbi:MAG: FmdB family zinc ribbon protein [Phycisphaerales bacterium JB040]